MGEIVSVGKLEGVVKVLKKQGKKIILVGGCFDILHPGHVVFLEKAKRAGDVLVVFVESDKKVKYLKGPGRPVHTQKERAKVLSALRVVDYVLMLPDMVDKEYDRLIDKIKPDVIAATRGNGIVNHHRRAAELTGAKFKFVTKEISGYSTSKILNH